MAKYKLSYFNIEAAAEKVRLAFVMNGIEFEDNRVAFDEWPALKPSTPYGQLPILEFDGKMMSQSYAMVRHVGKMGDGSLYPNDKAVEIDEIIGLHEDMAKDFGYPLYMGMRPEKLGHAFANDEEKGAKVKEFREKWSAEDCPKWLGFYTKVLEKSGGGFFCGDKVTIADLCILPQIRHLRKGVVDHIPATCVDAFPVILAWHDRMMALPQLQAWYAPK